MGIFERILFVVLGAGVGSLIGGRVGKTEKQKRRYTIMGACVGAALVFCFSFIV